MFDLVIVIQGPYPENTSPQSGDGCTESDAQEGNSAWRVTSHLPGGSWLRKVRPGCSVGRGVSTLWALLDQPMEMAQTRPSCKGLVPDGGSDKSRQSDEKRARAET